MNGPVLQLTGLRRLPLIRQVETAECGIACLAMIAAYYGQRTDISQLRRKYDPGLLGMSLRTIVDLARELGFSSRPINVPLEMIRQVHRPAILHWDLNHFVVLRKIRGNRVFVHDPALGERALGMEEFSRHFTGIALELTPDRKFNRENRQQRLELSDLWATAHGMKSSLLQVLLLSLLLQIFILLSPLYLQLGIDEVLTLHDTHLLLVLALGFAGLELLRFATQTLRASIVLYFGSMLNYHMTQNLFNHLLRLPLAFFEKRHTGDILSRFASLEPARTLLSEGVVASVIDGVLVLGTLFMMFFYSPVLAGIVISALFLYILLRILFYHSYRLAHSVLIQDQALEQSAFIESVRGISSIKQLGGERERLGLWQKHFADVINSNAKLGRLDIGFENTSQLIFGLEHVLLVYAALGLTLDNAFSAGMIVAFVAYKRNFTDRARQLVETLIEFCLLRLHLERIADIALAEPETHVLENRRPCTHGALGLQLADVSFAYSKSTEKVINSVSLVVEPGEYVAITGPSGCGKTTLLKLMTGLVAADSGRVLVAGEPLCGASLAAYRKRIGVVMQEDSLFSGSIAENIAFFSRHTDMELVIKAARLAFVHEDILALPMAYESPIGDMGAALSAGQKQRIILARALYRRPAILFMDECTAHLDRGLENQVTGSIRNLDITRVCVAHSPRAIASADRIIALERGSVVEASDFITCPPES